MKSDFKKEKEDELELRKMSIDENLPSNLKPYIEQARDKGASTWLTASPIEEQNFCLTKGEFRDGLKLRYNIPLEELPSFCPCGQKFTVSHALSCKKGGFINMRHDNF